MYEKLSPKARRCMQLSEAFGSLILTVIIVAVWYFFGKMSLPVSRNWIWLVVAVSWLYTLIAPFVRYERYRYRFSEEDIDVKEGFLFVHRDIVPIERLHKVAMVSGPFDRIFGLSKVIVTTAGGDVTIRFLQTKTAEEIVSRLKTRINQYAVKERDQQVQ